MRTIGNGYKYSKEFKSKVIEDYNRRNKGKLKCTLNTVAKSFGVHGTTLHRWLGHSGYTNISAKIDKGTIIYKGKTYIVDSKLPKEETDTKLRAEGVRLFKDLNTTASNKLKKIKNHAEYYKKIASILKDSIFTEEVVVEFKATSGGNIWDSKLATNDKLQKRVDILRLLIKYINGGLISTYSDLLKATRVLG